MKKAGFGSVAHVPCIFNGLWQYEVEASLYLRQRALLEISITDVSRVESQTMRYPTSKSLETFGAAITNFLEWCEASELKWQGLDFTNGIIKGYQARMLDGTWSDRNKSLAANTVNGRVGEVCNFLGWAASQGFRGPFRVISSSRAISSNSKSSTIGHKPKLVKQRAGVVRPDPKRMRMPTDSEVAAWHQSVQIEFGFTKALACELVVKTGVRREEVVQWQVDTLPLERAHWKVLGDYVTVEVKYGAKGQKHRDSTGELAGPSRFITVPLELAERIAEYRELKRPRLLAKFAKAAKTMQERRARMSKPSRRLFLSDFGGRPISAASIYEAWTQVSRMPFPGWSPHPGRHYWACKWMLDAVKKRFEVLQRGKESEWTSREITATANDVLMFEVKPQLGHVSEETSLRYLTWLQNTLTLTEVSDAYAASLDSMARTNIDR